MARGIEFPDQGLNLGPLHGEQGVLATGPPEKLLMQSFLNNLFEIASTAPLPFPAVWGPLPPCSVLFHLSFLNDCIAYLVFYCFWFVSLFNSSKLHVHSLIHPHCLLCLMLSRCSEYVLRKKRTLIMCQAILIFLAIYDLNLTATL